MVRKVFTPFRVGLLVLGSGATLVLLIAAVSKGGLTDRDSIGVVAYFRDASGLSPKSRVQIAGIPVGEVQRIELEGTRAKVFLRIRREIDLRQDASLTKRSESLLGDYLIDLHPGSEGAPPLPDGGEIEHVIDTEAIQATFQALSQITGDIQRVTTSLSEVLGGEKGAGSLQQIVENLIRLSDSVDQAVRQSGERLAAILENFQRVSEDVRGITGGEEESIRQIIRDVAAVTGQARELLAAVKEVLGSGESDLPGSVAGLEGTMKRLDATLANLEDVTRRVKEGQGALGTLVSDERLGQKISETVEDVSDFAQRLTQIQTEIAIRSEYQLSTRMAKNALGVRIIPKPDKYYLLEVVDDAHGSVETVLVQNEPPSAGEPATQRRTVTTDSLKLSAQLAKRYANTTLRFGIIESKGGVGVDVAFPLKYFWHSRWIEDALTLKLDAFDFSLGGAHHPHLRATVRLVPYEHVFVAAGVDDALSSPALDPSSGRVIKGRDFFLGAGIYFTDDDLKAVLSAAPLPSP